MLQGHTGEINLLSTGKLGLSPLSSIFTPSPPNNWARPPSKKLLFRIGIEKGYSLKKIGLDKLKIMFSISNCIKAVFNYVFFKKS